MRFSGIFIICFSLSFTVYAQIHVSQQVLASGGVDAKSAKLSVSSTLGETFIYGGKTDNFFYCQGFHGGNEAVITAVFETEAAALDLKYFPNPSHDFLQLRWQNAGLISNLSLLDEKGSLVLQTAISEHENQATLDLRTLISGKYILLFNDKTNRTFSAGWIVFTR
ncbi:MAG TPA: hypothetical protein PK037_16185 [Saprospiraceae bacterium]|nr:hypothetical protein [Saprospiraceae bacterium]